MNAKLQRAHEEIQDCLDAWTDDNAEAYAAVCAARDAIEKAQALLSKLEQAPQWLMGIEHVLEEPWK